MWSSVKESLLDDAGKGAINELHIEAVEYMDLHVPECASLESSVARSGRPELRAIKAAVDIMRLSPPSTKTGVFDYCVGEVTISKGGIDGAKLRPSLASKAFTNYGFSLDELSFSKQASELLGGDDFCH